MSQSKTNPPQPASSVWNRGVEGLNLHGATLGQELGDRPTLLVFLRHVGCTFCRETVADLKRATAERDDYPPILFVVQGTPAQAKAFFKDRWPEARVVAEPNTELYNAFGLQRGSVGQMFGPEVWASGARAATKGHGVGKPVGDPWMMPGLFYVWNQGVWWHHPYRHAGDHPNWQQLPDKLPQPVEHDVQQA